MLTGLTNQTSCFRKMAVTLFALKRIGLKEKGLATGSNGVQSQECWGTMREKTLPREALTKPFQTVLPEFSPTVRTRTRHSWLPEPTVAPHYLQSEIPAHSSESPVITPDCLSDSHPSISFLGHRHLPVPPLPPQDTPRCIYIPFFPHLCVRKQLEI